jgi:hypothetical protein
VTVRLIATVVLRLPDLPVMVTVDVTATAEGATVSVRMALAGVVPALNEPATPAGRPEMLTVTAFEKPFCGVRESVLLPVAPCGMLSAVGEADKMNVGCGVMVSATVVLAIRTPEVPVMVTVAEDAAVLAAVKVTVLWPAITGLKAAVTPAGSPDAASATVALKPF